VVPCLGLAYNDHAMKLLKFSVPPGYWRWKPPVKPKLGSFIAIIDAILAEDKSRSKK
jgi:hypothetical protein